MKTGRRIDNTDVIPLALFELGGKGRFVDIENLFMRCYEIAPERFTWRKYELPNYKIASKALRDFEDKYPGLLIRTGDGLQRQLSADGIKWIESRLPVYKGLLSEERREPPHLRPSQRILNEVESSELFSAFDLGHPHQATKYEIADLLLCSPDSPVAIWNERIETLKSAAEASRRSELVEFFEHIETRYSEWFGKD